MEKSSVEYGSGQPQPRRDYSWGALFGIVGFISLLIVVAFVIHRAVEANKGPCDKGSEYQRECMLERTIEHVLMFEDGDTALGFLRQAQAEYLGEAMGRITSDDNLVIMAVPEHYELVLWVTALQNQYRYFDNFTRSLKSDEIIVTNEDQLIAVYRNQIMTVWTIDSEITRSRVIRNCQGYRIDIYNISDAFSCPVMEVVIETTGWEDEPTLYRRFNSLGLAIDDWRPVPTADIVVPNERG